MEQVDHSNHKFIKIEAEVGTGITISKANRTGIGQIVVTERQYRQDRGRTRYEQGYRGGNIRGNMRSFDRQNSRGAYRNNHRNDGYNRSKNRPRE